MFATIVSPPPRRRRCVQAVKTGALLVNFYFRLAVVGFIDWIAPHEHPCPDCHGSLDDEDHRHRSCPRDR
jgi:hypothetical protein